MFINHTNILFCEVSIQIFYPFSTGISAFCKSPLHILHISPICIINIFFHFIGSLFTFPIVSFHVQKFLILICSNFSILLFTVSDFFALCKGLLPTPRSWRCSSMFCSKCFIDPKLKWDWFMFAVICKD